jgi:hypothetical protein
VLPRQLRERVFEPAYHDLLAESGRERPGLGWRVVWLAMDCVRLGLVDTVVRERRPTPVGWALILGAVVTTALATFSALTANYHQPPG